MASPAKSSDRPKCGANSVSAGAGDDTINGDASTDTIVGGVGADSMTGGGGADVFFISSGESGLSLAAADRIDDFDAADRFEFGLAAGSGTNYVDGGAAADFATALTNANTAMNGTVLYAAYDIGADVVVFADLNGDGSADQAVILVGRALTDVSSGSFL